ncbi:glycosyltransferase [Isoptericola variabilis]|uniref:glycosyltransferase n=1 Tax=Isoptericola variabilis TaxID=139208 RepID=UPI003D1F67BF
MTEPIIQPTAEPTGEPAGEPRTSRSPIFVVVHQFGSGGVTQAVQDQCRMFADAGHPVTLVVLSNELTPARVEHLREQGRIGPDVAVRGPALDLAQAWADVDAVEDPTGTAALLAGPGVLVEGRGTAPGLERWYAPDGSYLAHVKRDAGGAVVEVGRHRGRDVGVRERWSDGRVRHVEHLALNGVVDREVWYTPNGHPWMSRAADPESHRGRGVAIHRPGAEPELYAGGPAWHVAWLEALLAEPGTDVVALAETASTIPKLARARGDHVRRFGMLHNNQFAAPFTVGSPLRSDHADLFATAGRLDGLVVLTEPQRRHVLDIVGEDVPVHVVPNATRLPAGTESVAKDPHLVTVMSRISPQKALHEAIHAFALVVAEVPEARLEIYGRGPSRAELEALVERLGLTGSVTFPGRTSDPHGVMARSVCTLSTSDWEAMPLSIMESQAAGTPVVAYDCLYGPATLIEDGVTGRLLDRGDREGVARAVVELLRDPDRAAAMGATARERVAERYTAPVVARQWERVFGEG